jgi:uncharacterized protein YegL
VPRKGLSSPLNNDPPPPPPEKTTPAGDLECFQRARPFRAVALTLFLFLLDVSGSMRGKSIESLRNGFRIFRDAVRKHPRASRAVEVALVAVCGDKPTLLARFQPAAELAEPTLEAGGGTPLNSAFLMGLEQVEAKRADYAAKGIDCRTPLILAITDGQATDEDFLEQAKAAIAAAEEAKPPRVEVYGLAVNANALGELEEVLVRRPVLVEKFGFEEVMKKLSQSVIEFSVGRTKDVLQPLQEPLPKPAAEKKCEPRE